MVQAKIPLLIITGPTASGKSKLAIEIANRYDGEIISADSMQLYKRMDIGTAKSTAEEMQGIPHHLVSEIEPTEDFSVAGYVNLARLIIAQVSSRGRLPILVGGTTLYIQSIIENIIFFDLPGDEQLRLELRALAETNGNEAIWEKLNEVDPLLAKSLHPNNLGRVIRGIEVFATSGKSLSYWQEKSRTEPTPHNYLLLGLSYKNRELLYDRINMRVDEMIRRGLLDEVRALHAMDCSRTAKQAIGYKELWPAISGERSLDECVEALKQETRRYAKRQLTWMRGRPELHPLYHDELTSNVQLIDKVENLVAKHLIT